MQSQETGALGQRPFRSAAGASVEFALKFGLGDGPGGHSADFTKPASEPINNFRVHDPSEYAEIAWKVAGMIDDMAQVIRFEQRGCGRSQPIPPYDIETCLIDLENIRCHYQIDRWIIGGHSWGADLALIYALEHASRVAGLICIAGGRIHNDREWHDEYERRKEQEGERLPEFDYPPNMEVNKQLNRSWKRYIQSPGLLRAISKLEIPALFVYGAEDIRPGWSVEQIAHLMPDARFELIEGAEHVTWFSRSNELRSLLRSFVDDTQQREKVTV